MTAAEVFAVRNRLGLNQTQLAQLLGVHPLTVSKWERGLLVPSPHQKTLLRSFRKAAKKPDIGEQVAAALVAVGTAFALLLLLDAAFGKKK